VFTFIAGVIESPDTLRCIATTFAKTVVWYLLKYSFNEESIFKQLNMKNEETNGKVMFEGKRYNECL
jgi:hypothetical protein